jgi:hypothetical protein
MRRLLFLVGLGTVGIGLYKFYLRQYAILEDFDWRITNIKVISILPNLRVLMTYHITNNSEITATIEGYDVDVLVNGKKVSTIKNIDISKKLKGFGGETAFNFVADVKYKDLGIGTGGFEKLVSGVLDDVKNSTVTFKGHVDIKRGFISLPKYPVDIVYKLSEFGL